jgi:serine/threonine-protein kinase RIO1
LRVDPYLYTIGRRYPGLCKLVEAEGKRLTGNRKCLVHGDYSPKNLMVKENRMVIIDCEVAWSDAIKTAGL